MPIVASIGALRKTTWIVSRQVTAVTAILTIWTIHIIFLQAPIEASMGIVQKIFYFHVPIAYSMYLGATACFVGSAGYLFNG
ncbi:MAG: hypothetical protein ABIV93_18855 [Byssovorax sp.]